MMPTVAGDVAGFEGRMFQTNRDEDKKRKRRKSKLANKSNVYGPDRGNALTGDAKVYKPFRNDLIRRNNPQGK